MGEVSVPQPQPQNDVQDIVLLKGVSDSGSRRKGSAAAGWVSAPIKTPKRPLVFHIGSTGFTAKREFHGQHANDVKNTQKRGWEPFYGIFTALSRQKNPNGRDLTDFPDLGSLTQNIRKYRENCPKYSADARFHGN